MPRKDKRTAEYETWLNIRTRCRDVSRKDYKLYGGRGIKMCPEWMGDFSAFLAHVGPRPSSKHSIDRIDNARGYEPNNCRWVTAEEQANNRRSNRLYNFGGEMLTLRQIIKKTGHKISLPTLHARVFDYGWPIERAITKPVGR